MSELRKENKRPQNRISESHLWNEKQTNYNQCLTANTEELVWSEARRPNMSSLLHYNPPTAVELRALRKTMVIFWVLWRKRHVLQWLPVWKVSWKSPIRCKVSPYFAKKFRLNYYLPLKAIIYGFCLPVFAHVGQYEAKPTSFSEWIDWLSAIEI